MIRVFNISYFHSFHGVKFGLKVLLREKEFTFFIGLGPGAGLDYLFQKPAALQDEETVGQRGGHQVNIISLDINLLRMVYFIVDK